MEAEMMLAGLGTRATKPIRVGNYHLACSLTFRESFLAANSSTKTFANWKTNDLSASRFNRAHQAAAIRSAHGMKNAPVSRAGRLKAATGCYDIVAMRRLGVELAYSGRRQIRQFLSS
jgi:hypothetical protein